MKNLLPHSTTQHNKSLNSLILSAVDSFNLIYSLACVNMSKNDVISPFYHFTIVVNRQIVNSPIVQ